MYYPEFRNFRVKLTARKYVGYDVVDSENE
jgi:hypothetical protein